MTDPDALAADSRIAVIDLGSNSLRLVVFERLGGALFPLLNEKVMCGLGRSLSTTGRLHPEGVALALANLQRFVALARAIGVDRLAVLATAAVRDAGDGRAFAAEVERQCQVAVDILDGAEEARLSAAGVLAGIPLAEGVVADLGGGSIELIAVGPRAGAGGRIGQGVTLPLGPLRLAELGAAPRTIAETVERELAGSAVWDAIGRGAARGGLYLVGGAARAIARLHMEHSRYPLHIIHRYTIARAEAEAFFDIVARQSKKSLAKIMTIAPKRLEVVPIAALVLRHLIAAAAPKEVIFSAFGLREGYAYGHVPHGADPLIEACRAVARRESRFRPDGDRLQEWAAPLFPNLDERRRRLHRAACWLSDIAWSDHPDYRAEQAFTRSLRMPFACASHGERVFIASVLHSRYGGAAEAPYAEPTRPLLDDRALGEARTLGLALRLAYTLCGGTLALLSEVSLGRDDDRIVLAVPSNGHLFVGETVQRRLDAVARSLGSGALVRRRARERAALA
ncbi:MAG TPA: Ppx/GppA family phosphatase [Stellaceae bacterium]|nr:Ppx/GppA family phosphatase [Stellaceae bacterium]